MRSNPGRDTGVSGPPGASILLPSQIEEAARQVATDMKEQGHGSERAPRGVLLRLQTEKVSKHVAKDTREQGPRHGSERPPRGVLLLSQIEGISKQSRRGYDLVVGDVT